MRCVVRLAAQWRGDVLAQVPEKVPADVRRNHPPNAEWAKWHPVTETGEKERVGSLRINERRAVCVLGRRFSAVAGRRHSSRPHNRKVREVNIRYNSVGTSEPPVPEGKVRCAFMVGDCYYTIDTDDNPTAVARLKAIVAILASRLSTAGLKVEVLS